MAVAITKTYDGIGTDATVASTVATYSSKSIGTASSDRIVVVCVTSEFVTGTITSATIDFGSGDTAMKAGAQGTLGNNSARCFWLNVTSGTTATIKVTFGANPSTTTQCITVYAVTGAYLSVGSGAHVSTDTDSSAPVRAAFQNAVTGGTTGFFDIPANGGFIAVVSGADDTTTKTWAGATKDVDKDAGGHRHTTATSTTGASAAITCTGTTNAEDAGLSCLVFCPNAGAFGDLKGVGGNTTTAVTNPFSPLAAIPVAVGDLVFVQYHESTAISATTCDDSLGNTYTALTSGTTVKAYYSIVTVAGDCSPRVTTTAGSNDASIAVAVFAGGFDSVPLDKNPAVLSDSAEPYTCNATGTLSQADELVVGYFGSQNNEGNYDTPGASTTIAVQVLPVAAQLTSAAITYKVVAATTTTTLDLSGSVGNRTTGCGVATFKKSNPAKTLSAGAGSYTLTGTAATLTLGHRLIAGGGSYAITGTDATPKHAWKLAAGAGSYTLSGTAASPLHAWKAAANGGSYTLTGSAVTLTLGHRLVAAGGSYALTGTNASTLHAWKLSAGAGSYALTGTAASPLHAWKLAAGAGSYTLSGTAASPLHGWKVAANSGSYAITGSAVTLTLGHTLVAAGGSYALTGSDATLTKNSATGFSLSAGAGSYALTGTSVSTLHAWKLSADASSYALTGTNASLLLKRILAGVGGSYIVVGGDATPSLVHIANPMEVIDTVTYSQHPVNCMLVQDSTIGDIKSIVKWEQKTSGWSSEKPTAAKTSVEKIARGPRTVKWASKTSGWSSEKSSTVKTPLTNVIPQGRRITRRSGWDN